MRVMVGLSSALRLQGTACHGSPQLSLAPWGTKSSFLKFTVGLALKVSAAAQDLRAISGLSPAPSRAGSAKVPFPAAANLAPGPDNDGQELGLKMALGQSGSEAQLHWEIPGLSTVQQSAPCCLRQKSLVSCSAAR
ncbi:hypothetical protein NDU88_004573 [Pleurodeles waltl]|uniref:Uncharacterized protein n=1 Tax=Pleurodeles waltl TaxID=8319 RepID=A0AAV7LKC0_PLEWA|nr:hypothetical protein NDU88_004573 [Pleurodeles waltl]